MNKYFILILAVMVTLVNSNDDCLRTLEDGGFRTKRSYANFTEEKRKLLIEYFDELYDSATKDYLEDMLLSSTLWCRAFYKNSTICINELKIGGYTNCIIGLVNYKSSTEALKYSYCNTTYNSIKSRNSISLAYYEYLLEEYKKILVKKNIRNPVEFCTNVTAVHLPSNYAGLFVNENMSHEKMNVQNQENDHNAEEGSSRLSKEVLDFDGYVIDLNFPPKNN